MSIILFCRRSTKSKETTHARLDSGLAIERLKANGVQQLELGATAATAHWGHPAIETC